MGRLKNDNTYATLPAMYEVAMITTVHLDPNRIMQYHVDAYAIVHYYWVDLIIKTGGWPVS